MQRLRVRPRAGPGPTPRLLTRPLLSNRACRSIARATGQATQPGAAVQHQERVTGACYEEIIDVLARRAMAAAAVAAAGSSAPGRPACRRHVVGVAGAPGSGKSTLAVEIMQRINALAVEAAAAATAEAAAAADGEGDGQQAGTQVALQGPRAVVLPMDGFHYYRRELDAMPDPKEAHARRGAPWTFDAAKFVEAVRRVRQAGEQEETRWRTTSPFPRKQPWCWWRATTCCLMTSRGGSCARRGCWTRRGSWSAPWTRPWSACSSARQASAWRRRCPVHASPPTTAPTGSSSRPRRASPTCWCPAPCPSHSASGAAAAAAASGSAAGTAQGAGAARTGTGGFLVVSCGIAVPWSVSTWCRKELFAG